MTDWSRRAFVGMAAGAPAIAFLDPLAVRATHASGAPSRRGEAAGGGDVFLSGDGLHRAPAEHASLLARLAAERIHALEPIAREAAPSLLLGVNESWNRTTGAALAEAFHRAAA